MIMYVTENLSLSSKQKRNTDAYNNSIVQYNIHICYDGFSYAYGVYAVYIRATWVRTRNSRSSAIKCNKPSIYGYYSVRDTSQGPINVVHMGERR